nr:HWE histidine kinase domain-containing protein [Lichenihabitans psoromatis]
MDDALSHGLNLDDCAREPIHLSGAVQPHGCLLVCRMSDWTVVQASLNAATVLDLAPDATILGQDLDKILDGTTVHDLRNTLQGSMVSGTAERLTDVIAVTGGKRVDLTVHSTGDVAIIEVTDHAGADTSTTDPIVLVKSMVGRIKRAPTLARILQTAAGQLRAVTGYDHVMIYRFLPDDSGEVVAEALRPGIRPLVGLRYPASDIPAQARALYKRQWLRMIVDVGYTPVPLIGLPGSDAAPIDLSLASLRSVSPIHLEYLRNMGSAATLTVSIMAGDKLWGLIACHHEAPRRLAATTCAACELFGQIFSLQIEAKQRDEELANAAKARDALDRLIATMPVEETLFDNLPSFESTLQALIECDGVGVWSEGRFTGVGHVPPMSGMPALIALLDQQGPHEPTVTCSLGLLMPLAQSFTDRVSGMMAVPFWRGTRDYLMFFRRELIQTVTWGGNPNKPVTITTDGTRISPRKSFEAWRETVRGEALPWRPSEIQIARSLRVSLLDVILRRADLLNTERKAAQESQSLLIAELNHRVKNVLALVRSLVRQSRQESGSVEDFTENLEQRIRALAFAHDQLTQVGWRGAPLLRLLQAEVQAWAGEAGERVQMRGPVVTLGSRAYQTLALVLHEMMTNAAKYGALSTPTGKLVVTWSLLPEGDLMLEWAEAGGPIVTTPKRRGFGTIIVEQTIPFELQGDSSVEYRPEGVVGRFRVPASQLVPCDLEAEPERREIATPLTQTDLMGKRLMLVEDSMMIALDAQGMMSDAGLGVEIAGNVADALRTLKVGAFDAAVLDVNLSGETSFPVADALLAGGVPFVFATGYGESTMIPARFRNVTVVAKPYDAKTLLHALGSAFTTLDLAASP